MPELLLLGYTHELFHASKWFNYQRYYESVALEMGYTIGSILVLHPIDKLQRLVRVAAYGIKGEYGITREQIDEMVGFGPAKSIFDEIPAAVAADGTV